ncbi:hypothetical protein [Bacillus alkalicellulosilyticus]|uniref:hypothetical protein n=1 Tax=Alkalihalobacterium alkalicellulosilyticum TaxID=1912214 RepID=UPI000996E55B|nr:hypothetical protein [Bacillus alkalicellulosilyticus]
MQKDGTLESQNMYKITCFAAITEEKLSNALRALRFKKTKEGYEWQLDSAIFKIIPFENQPRGKTKGFRVYFNGSIEGGIYLLDTSLGWLSPSITGVEYDMFLEYFDNREWVKNLCSRPNYKTLDTRGIFRKGPVGVVVSYEHLNLQIRASKGKQLKILDCLREVEKVREELQPVYFDLFSCLGTEVAI